MVLVEIVSDDGLRQNPVPYLSTEGILSYEPSLVDTHQRKTFFSCDATAAAEVAADGVGGC